MPLHAPLASFRKSKIILLESGRLKDAKFERGVCSVRATLGRECCCLGVKDGAGLVWGRDF
eukprot:5805993-Amphidinium_carterae.1